MIGRERTDLVSPNHMRAFRPSGSESGDSVEFIRNEGSNVEDKVVGNICQALVHGGVVNAVGPGMTKCVKPLRHLATSSTKSS